MKLIDLSHRGKQRKKTLRILQTLNNIPLSNYYESGAVIEGKLEIAKFNIITNDDNFTNNADPCTLKPIPVGIDLLIVPLDVVQRFGCNFIDDFISRNIWITNGITFPSGSNQSSLPSGSTILSNGSIFYPTNNTDVKRRNENNGQCKYFISKSSYDQQRSINCNSLQNQNQNRDFRKRDVSFSINDLLPKVIAFTSLNGGDPGIKEPVYNRDLLRNVSVGLTLLTKDDTTLIQSLNANIDHIKITSIKPTSILLTNMKLDKKGSKGMLHQYNDEEDERINSAAYTTRIAVVRPEPTYRINPNIIDVDLQFGTVRNGSEKILNNRNRFLDVDRESVDDKNLKDIDPSKDFTRLKPNNSSNGNGGKSESNKFDIIDL
ncbi:18304_t:CDS:2 [Racocetra fulgida]|uniref:18304_t:CDS:1 n=1 Tax=Racocetra fulgida TaxID=60492 RepID=A0A9N8VB08_9GLOM|nr:18304_t:CDS:2 [Racocetra fulgida]